MTQPPNPGAATRRSPKIILRIVFAVIAIAILVFLFTRNAQESEEPAAEDPQSALTDVITAEVRDATVEFTPGLVAVDFPIRQGPTPSETALGAQEDTIAILRAVQESSLQETVEITARIVPVDQTGSQDEFEALRVVYLPETSEQLDFQQIGPEVVWGAADEQMVHPVLRE